MYSNDAGFGRRVYFSDRFNGRDVTARFDFSNDTTRLNPNRIVYFGSNASDIVGVKLVNGAGLITSEVQYSARDYGATELGKSMVVSYTTKTILPAGVADTTTTQTVNYLADEVLNGTTKALKTCKHSVDYGNASQASQLFYNAPKLGAVKYAENPSGSPAINGGRSFVQTQFSVSPVPAGVTFLPLLLAASPLTPAQCQSLVPNSLLLSARTTIASRIETRMRSTFTAANDPLTAKAGFLRTDTSSGVNRPVTGRTYYGAFADGSPGVTSFELDFDDAGKSSGIAQYLAAEYPNSLVVGVEQEVLVAARAFDANRVETFSDTNVNKVTFLGTVVASTLAGNFNACLFQSKAVTGDRYFAYVPGLHAVQQLTISATLVDATYRELVKVE